MMESLPFKCLTFLCLLISLALPLEAASLDCSNLSTAECKAKFGEQFLDDYKALHSAGLKDLFNLFEPIAAAIVEDLPKNDAIAEALKLSVDKLRVDIHELDEKVQDNRKINRIINNITRALDWIPDATGSLETYEKSLEEHRVHEIITDRLNKFAVDVGNLYVEMHAKLRPEDLKAYPEYDELKAIMVKMQSSEKNAAKFSHYAAIREYLGSEFQLPYFAEVSDLFL